MANRNCCFNFRQSPPWCRWQAQTARVRHLQASCLRVVCLIVFGNASHGSSGTEIAGARVLPFKVVRSVVKAARASARGLATGGTLVPQKKLEPRLQLFAWPLGLLSVPLGHAPLQSEEGCAERPA